MKRSPLLIVALLAGCAQLQIGADPIVVNAERTEKLAFDTVDSFLQFEKTNQTAIKQSAPDVHKYAETLRRNFPMWMFTARSLTNAYKANRTDQNKASLLTAVAVLTTAQIQVQQYISQLSKKGP